YSFASSMPPTSANRSAGTLRTASAGLGAGLVRNGILLYGPRGTGKTFLARATAGEFGLNFDYVSAPKLGHRSPVGAAPRTTWMPALNGRCRCRCYGATAAERHAGPSFGDGCQKRRRLRLRYGMP